MYDGDVPIGSCQAGPRDRLSKLVKQYGLPPDPEAWTITCFQIAPAHRGKGVAAHLLGRVLRDLKSRGTRLVETFPKRGAGLDEMDLWTGPEAMYREAGFVVVRDDPDRPVMSLTIGVDGP